MPLDAFPGIQVNAYDTTDEPVRARFKVDDRNWRPLKPTGEFTWHARPARRSQRTPVSTRIDVQAADAAGAAWTQVVGLHLHRREGDHAGRRCGLVPAPRRRAAHSVSPPTRSQAGQRLAWSLPHRGHVPHRLAGHRRRRRRTPAPGTRTATATARSTPSDSGHRQAAVELQGAVRRSTAASRSRTAWSMSRPCAAPCSPSTRTTGTLKWKHDPEPAPAGQQPAHLRVLRRDGCRRQGPVPVPDPLGEASQGLLHRPRRRGPASGSGPPRWPATP